MATASTGEWGGSTSLIAVVVVIVAVVVAVAVAVAEAAASAAPTTDASCVGVSKVRGQPGAASSRPASCWSDVIKGTRWMPPWGLGGYGVPCVGRCWCAACVGSQQATRNAHALFAVLVLPRTLQVDSGAARIGYIMNMLPTTITTDDGVELAALDLYMLQQDGGTFKATITHSPYFYIVTKPRFIKDVAHFLERRFEGTLLS